MAEVRVPATSANMGAGFDTMGIALSLYNTIKVEEIDSGLKVINKNTKEYIPQNESNLIYRSVKRVFDEVGYSGRGIKIIQDSAIPMTRGLGSSSACIVGGLLAGNAISGRHLTYEKMLDMAVEIEGHPDNVVPAMYGGFCISVREGERTYHKSHKISPKLRYAIMVPDFFIPTRRSRGLLPEMVSLDDAAHNVSRAAWLATCLVSGDFSALHLGVDDRLHQPYRKGTVKGLDDIIKESYNNGAKASFLSGSGPTVISILDGNFNEFKIAMNEFFRLRDHKWQCKILEIDNVGAVLKI